MHHPIFNVARILCHRHYPLTIPALCGSLPSPSKAKPIVVILAYLHSMPCNGGTPAPMTLCKYPTPHVVRSRARVPLPPPIVAHSLTTATMRLATTRMLDVRLYITSTHILYIYIYIIHPSLYIVYVSGCSFDQVSLFYDIAPQQVGPIFITDI